jgi:hypothetical protein
LKDFPLNKEELENLIEILQEAVKHGFSTLTPPLIPMLEVLIDLNLRMANFFKEGGPLQQQENPSIKELDFADALGNAKMIKLFDKPKWAYADPKISFIFKRTAEGLVKFKNSGNPIHLVTFAVTKWKEINRPSVKEPKDSKTWYFQRKARKRRKNKVIT